jgi:CheY-like chemotaxis protein
MMAHTGLENRRILIVEDENLIAIVIEDTLQSAGCITLGPVGKLDAAVLMATEEQIDAAVLDVTIRGGQVFPVADVLIQRNIPFVFASGYGDWALPEAFRGMPRLSKPYTPDELEAALAALPMAN